MKKTVKKAICVVLLIALACSMSVPSVSEAKKKEPKLNKKKLTITVGKTAKLKVKNTNKKVKWSIKSGKKQIKLTKKKKTSVVILAKKKGNATVVAKIGKKKLSCKVTVQPKKMNDTTNSNVANSNTTNSNTTNNNTANSNTTNNNDATAVKVASVAIVNRETVKVTLTSAQQLTAENFVLKKKEIAHASYYKTLTIVSVTSTDNITYIIKVDSTASKIKADHYVQVTVSGLMGTGTQTLETVNAEQYEYESISYHEVTAGKEIYQDIYADECPCMIVSQKLPEGISCQIEENNNNNTSLILTGTFEKTGKYVGEVVYKNERGDTYTHTINWVVGDDNTIQAQAESGYGVLDKGSRVDLSTTIYAIGGSEEYNYTVVDDAGVSLSVENDVVRGEFDVAGEYNIKIKVEDAKNADIFTTFVWTVTIKEGKRVVIKVKDAIGNEIRNSDFVEVTFSNEDPNFLYGSDEKYKPAEDGTYYVNVLDGTYRIEVSAYNYTKTYYNVKVDESTTSIDVSAELFPIHMDLEGIDLSEAEWRDEEDSRIAYGDKIYLGKGTYKLFTTLSANDKEYKLKAEFNYTGKEITVPVEIVSEKDWLSGTITIDNPINVTLAEDYVYYAFVPEESGNYLFYSEMEDAEVDTYGVLLDENKEMIMGNDDYAGSNFGIEATCEAGKTYYIGIRPYNQDDEGESSNLFVVKNVPEEE